MTITINPILFVLLLIIPGKTGNLYQSIKNGRVSSHSVSYRVTMKDLAVVKTKTATEHCRSMATVLPPSDTRLTSKSKSTVDRYQLKMCLNLRLYKALRIGHFRIGSHPDLSSSLYVICYTSSVI